MHRRDPGPTRALTIGVAMALALLLAACGDEEGATDEPTEPPEASDEASDDAEEEPTASSDMAEGEDALRLEAAERGTITHLVDGDGITVYLFTEDDQGTSVCYDACETNWPPLISDAAAAAGEGIDADLIGSSAREDGTEQVTYDGWPLYYWAGDSEPGDVNGQGVSEVWYVVAADGSAITSDLDEDVGQGDAARDTSNGGDGY